MMFVDEFDDDFEEFRARSYSGGLLLSPSTRNLASVKSRSARDLRKYDDKTNEKRGEERVLFDYKRKDEQKVNRYKGESKSKTKYYVNINDLSAGRSSNQCLNVRNIDEKNETNNPMSDRTLAEESGLNSAQTFDICEDIDPSCKLQNAKHVNTLQSYGTQNGKVKVVDTKTNIKRSNKQRYDDDKLQDFTMAHSASDKIFNIQRERDAQTKRLLWRSADDTLGACGNENRNRPPPTRDDGIGGQKSDQRGKCYRGDDDDGDCEWDCGDSEWDYGDSEWDYGESRQRLYSMPSRSRNIQPFYTTIERKVRSFTICSEGHLYRGPVTLSAGNLSPSCVVSRNSEDKHGESFDSYRVLLVGKMLVGKRSIINNFVLQSPRNSGKCEYYFSYLSLSLIFIV